MPAVDVVEVEKSVEGSKSSAREERGSHFLNHEIPVKRIKLYMAGATGAERSVWKNMLREMLTKRPSKHGGKKAAVAKK